MTKRMLANRLPILIGVVVLAVLAWAWIDGGREPVRALSEPVAVPGAMP